MEKMNKRRHYRAWSGRSLALLLVVVALPSQAEYYKWLDEAGQVHYTQTPPSAQQAEVIRVDTDAPAPAPPGLSPTEKEGVKTCGSLILPARRLDPVTSVAMYRQAIALWQKYIEENGQKSDDTSLRGVSERRCAITYANKELQALSEVEQGITTNYQEALGELEDLQQQVAECDEAEGSVATCKQQHQPRIEQLKKMLHTLEGRKKMIAPDK